MADLATSELEARIRQAGTFAESMASTLPSVPNKAMAWMSMNASYATMAAGALALGRADAARQAFGQVAACLFELRGQDLAKATGADRRGLLEFSLLSGRNDLASRTLSEPLASTYPDLGPVADGYLRALHSLAKGDDAGARAAATALVAVPEEKALKAKYYPGLGQVVEAILSASEDALRRALDAVLETHVRFARKGHLRGLESSLYCTPATCLALLARRRGLTPSVEARFAKVPLQLRVTALAQWEGRPTKDLTFEVQADVLPLNCVG
jgi:hypothetical protein